MKKRIVSLLLALCLLAGLLPAVTPQADAVISTVIGTSLKMCTSLVKGGIYACRNGSEYDNAGQGVLAVFKYAGSDLLGIDFGGSSSGQTKETVIQKVDLSKVEAELSSISKQLEKNSAAIHQLERTVSNGIASLSQQMENLSGQIQNATLELKYSTYLNTFFEFFNQYYEALSYYDRLVTDMLDESASPAYQKNIYDQFYSLQNVEYSGNLHSAVDKLGRYLQGKYIYSGPGSVVDVLTQYYILAYQGGGKTEEEARAAAAQSTQDMIVYLYYAYVMGAYYEQAIALYQTAYITENGGLYQTDFGTMISQKQIDATVTALWSDVEQTAGCILGDLRSNYHQDVAFEVVYQTPGGRMLNRTITGDSFVIENGANFWLRDPAEELAKYFDESLSEAFSGIAKFTIRAQSAADPTYLQIHDNAFFHVKTTEEGGFEYGRRFLKLDVEFGGKTMQTITLVLYKQIDSGPFAGGLGTEDYPYIIITADQFAAISPQDTSKPSYADCQFILHNELNMEGKSFPGMRNFSGTFDGNGHEIYNVVLTGVGGDTAHTVGLFGELTGTVRNLVVRNATVTGLTADGDSGGRSGDLCVGVLAGLVNGGRIEYCAVYDSSVTGEHNGAGVAYAGGAVGKLAGKETGEAGEAALRGVVCVDTSVRAVTTKAANPQEFLPWADGSAIAGGLIGYYLTGTINECGYIQSENFQGSISAKGATGAAAGGLTGYERAPFSNLMWLALGAAPKVEKQNASAEDRYYQVGLLTGNGYAANAVYHLWGSRASERGSTPLNGDPWWQLQWSTKAVDKITTKALQGRYRWGKLEGKAVLRPRGLHGARGRRGPVSGVRPRHEWLGISGRSADGRPDQKELCRGRLSHPLRPERLAGCRLPCGGRCQVPVFRDHAGRKSDQQAAAGRRIPVRRAGVQRLSRHLQDHGEAYGAHLHLGYDGADLHGGGLHESDVPALRPDEAGRGAGGAGPRCRDGRRRPADVRFRRLDRGQPLRALRRGLHGADDGSVYGRACPCGHAG